MSKNTTFILSFLTLGRVVKRATYIIVKKNSVIFPVLKHLRLCILAPIHHLPLPANTKTTTRSNQHINY